MDEQLEPRDSYDLGFITAPGEYDDELLDYTIDEKFGIKTYAVYGNPYPPIAIEATPKGDNQSEFATHTYNLTHQKSYYPLTFYRDQQPTIVRFTNWEWAIGDEFTSGSFTSLNDINATLKYNNVTYTLKGRN